jgi:hypothetical protein
MMDDISSKGLKIRPDQAFVASIKYLRDPRVNIILKIIMGITVLLYIMSPVDLLPLLPFDDLAAPVAGMYLFNLISFWIYGDPEENK